MSQGFTNKRQAPKTAFKKGQTPWNKGKKASMETIEKLRKSHLGKTVSDETKQKMSLVHLGNKANTGRKLTQEHKLNISNALNSKNPGYYFKTEKLCKCCNTPYIAQNLGSKYCSRKCLAKDRDWCCI